MEKQIRILLLISLIILLIAINYNTIDGFLIKNFEETNDFVFVGRVIDGDTVKTIPPDDFGKSNEISIRLLGINSPEKGEKYSLEAKEYLENLVLNKTVELKYGKDKTDRYNRTLAYIYLKNKNVNLELVEKGYANFYFPSGKDIYYDSFFEAWEECIVNNENLCEKSEEKCAECIELKKFDYKNQKVIFYNACEFNCDLTNWEIKDEGRKKFVFEGFVLNSFEEIEIRVGEGENTEKVLFWTGKTYVWTYSGDTLFLRDSEGKLILWRAY